MFDFMSISAYNTSIGKQIVQKIYRTGRKIHEDSDSGIY